MYLYKLEKKTAIGRYLFNSATANVMFYRYFIHFSPFATAFVSFFFFATTTAGHLCKVIKTLTRFTRHTKSYIFAYSVHGDRETEEIE